MCKVLAPQQLVPYEHSLVSLLLKYRLEKSILGHQAHCPTVTGTMSYNHLLKFATLKRQVICPYWTYWMSASNLHFTEAQEHSHSQPIDAQYIAICSYASLAYLLFLFCVLYVRQSHPLTSFARVTKSRFSVVSCKISFFLMILYFILFKAWIIFHVASEKLLTMATLVRYFCYCYVNIHPNIYSEGKPEPCPILRAWRRP